MKISNFIELRKQGQVNDSNFESLLKTWAILDKDDQLDAYDVINYNREALVWRDALGHEASARVLSKVLSEVYSGQ